MRIDVAKLAGVHCITAEDGEALLTELRLGLSQPEDIELDFSGTSVFASPFFNAAIGPLLGDHTAEELNRRIKWLHLAPDGAAVLRRVIKNSREYFTNERTRDVVDSASHSFGRADSQA